MSRGEKMDRAFSVHFCLGPIPDPAPNATLPVVVCQLIFLAHPPVDDPFSSLAIGFKTGHLRSVPSSSKPTQGKPIEANPALFSFSAGIQICTFTQSPARKNLTRITSPARENLTKTNDPSTTYCHQNRCGPFPENDQSTPTPSPFFFCRPDFQL